MKMRVLKQFYDTENDVIRKPDETFEVGEKRASKLIAYKVAVEVPEKTSVKKEAAE